jgi:hypothetical protein
LVERHWKEIRPSNQRLTPKAGTAVSEARVILGRSETHYVWERPGFGFLTRRFIGGNLYDVLYFRGRVL